MMISGISSLNLSIEQWAEFEVEFQQSVEQSGTKSIEADSKARGIRLDPWLVWSFHLTSQGFIF